MRSRWVRGDTECGAGRQAAEKRHTELGHRVEQRTDIIYRNAGRAHCRDHEVIRRLIFLAITLPKLAAEEKCAQHFSDIAVSREKPRSETLDERYRRLVGNKILRQLEGDVTGGSRALCKNVERFLPFGLASRPQRARLPPVTSPSSW